MLDKKTAVEGVKMFVLDMDGTFYLGDRLIEGSLDFLEKVKDHSLHNYLSLSL